MQLTYNFVVKKFEELKGFVQNCENAIDSTQNDYFNKKKEAENRWNSEANRMKIQFEADKKAMVRKAENMLEDALQISGEIAQIEQTLLIKDKYYKKTKIKKESELSSRRNDGYDSGNDYFKILDDIRSDFERISRKIFNTDEKIRRTNGILDSPMEVNIVERMLYINRNGNPTK